MGEKNTNLQSTTVKGDPDEIEALKKMGHGMLSHAFRVGCKVVLGTTNQSVEQLLIKREEMEKQKTYIEGVISQIDTSIESIQNQKKQTRLADIADRDQFERAVSEYKRCAPLIIYKNMTMIPSHLAGLMDWTSTKEVKEFFAGRVIEPTEEEIREFLENR